MEKKRNKLLKGHDKNTSNIQFMSWRIYSSIIILKYTEENKLGNSFIYYFIGDRLDRFDKFTMKIEIGKPGAN